METMASLFNLDIVSYLCSCGQLKPISRIYFCRHCIKLRCSECVSHEVDSHYCSNCLESMPSAEARLKKNRCANCLDCPSCKHVLSTRATIVQIANTEEKSPNMKKVYYLSCNFCRWTSRDSDIPDQSVASGGWQELENPNSKYINNVMEYYRSLVQWEKAERERRKYSRRISYFYLNDKYRFSAVAARKRAGLPPIGSSPLSKEEFPDVKEAESIETVDPLPANYFTEEPILSQISTLPQRLLCPEFQLETAKTLYPSHHHLVIKRSQRCRHCEHNLSKPEYHPSSIKFKIRLSAYYHVPEVRLLSPPTLKAGQPCTVGVTIRNPTQYEMRISLKALKPGEDIVYVPPKIHSLEADTVDVPADLEGLVISEENCIFQDNIPQSLQAVSVACNDLIVAPHDDAAEFDDFVENKDFKDDPSLVIWRKGNKVAVKLTVTPSDACEGGIAWIGLCVEYDYSNTITMATNDKKEPQKVTITIPVFINLGPLCPGEDIKNSL